MDAAIATVTANGYEATTMEAIAHAAGASKATLYRHWSGKPTLVVTALRENSGIHVDTIDTGLSLTPETGHLS
jgi:AcrR family transcriptional regulator